MKKFLVLLSLLSFSVWADGPIQRAVSSTIADGDTSVTIDLDLKAEINVIEVTVPEVFGTPTLTLSILTPIGTMATKAAIAEGGVTRLDPSDFDAGLEWLCLNSNNRLQYTLTTATSGEAAVITTRFYGREF